MELKDKVAILMKSHAVVDILEAMASACRDNEAIARKYVNTLSAKKWNIRASALDKAVVETARKCNRA